MAYRFSNSFAGPGPTAPGPRNSWEQAERILKILERNPIQPPGAIPQPQAWPHGAGEVRSMPFSGPVGHPPRGWDFNRAQDPSRPFEALLSSAATSPATDGTPDPGDYGYGLPVPPPPVLAPEEDLPPRIAAIVPRRSDREIADEIWAKLAAEQQNGESDAQPEPQYGVGNLFGLIGSAQAQARGGSGRRYTEPMPQGRAELYSLMQRRLLAAEPSNPFLTTIQPRGYVPNEQEINTLWREMAEAEARAASGQPPRPQGYLGPMPRQRGGETEYTIAGRVGHAEKQRELRGQGYEIERPLESGRRVDAVRTQETDAHIKEIKSDNPRGIARAQRQAESYAREYETEINKPTTWELELYNILEVLKRLLPGN